MLDSDVPLSRNSASSFAPPSGHISGKVRGLGDKDAHIAAAYVQDAFSGLHRFGHGYSLTRPSWAQRAYSLRFETKWLRFLLVGTMFVQLLVPFARPGCNDARRTQPLLGAFELVAALLYVVIAGLDVLHMGLRGVLGKPSRCIQCLITAVILVDIVVMLATNRERAIFSAILLPLLVICINRQLINVLKLTWNTLRRLLAFFVLLALFLFIYAVIGVSLFHGLYDPNWFDEGNFDTVERAALSLFVLLTTESYPLVTRPATRNSMWPLIYFVSFLILMVLLFLSALVGAFVDASKETIEQQAREESSKEQRACLLAYKFLYDPRCNGVKLEECKVLARHLAAELSGGDVEMCFFLHTDTKLVLSPLGFHAMCTSLWNLMHERMVDKSHKVRQERIRHSTIGGSPSMKRLKEAVTRDVFERAIAAFLVIHSISLLFYRQSLPSFLQTFIIALNLMMEFILLLEFVVKISVFRRFYFQDNRRQFEFGLLVVVLGLSIAAAVILPTDADRALSIQELASGVILFRLLTSVENFFGIVSWHQVIRHSYAQAISHFMLYIVLVFVSFSLIGEALFCPHMSKHSSEFADFQNFGFSLLTMLQVFSTSNWHIILFDVVRSTTLWSSIFFVVFFFSLVLITLNLLIALFADAVTVQRLLFASRSAHVQHPLDERQKAFSKGSLKGKGNTWRAITNVFHNAHSNNRFFEQREHDSKAKRRWKMASRIVVERNKFRQDIAKREGSGLSQADKRCCVSTLEMRRRRMEARNRDQRQWHLPTRPSFDSGRLFGPSEHINVIEMQPLGRSSSPDVCEADEEI